MDIKLENLPEIDQDSYKPLYAQLTDALLKFIKDNDLQPGAPLPSEAELIRHYGMSRMTVRFAIQRLATEGVLTKKQGIGTFVAEKPISSDLQGIKSLDEKLKQQGVVIDNVLLEAEISDHTIELWTNELNLPKESRLFKIRRLKKVDGKAFALEIRFIPPNVTSLFNLNNLTTVPLIELFNSENQTAITKVRYRTRSEALLERYTTDLGVEPGAPGLVQFATYYNKDDEPVLTGKLIFVGTQMELRHEVNLSESNSANEQFLPEVSPQDSVEQEKTIN